MDSPGGAGSTKVRDRAKGLPSQAVLEGIQAVFADAPLALLVLDCERRVVLANAAAAALAGRSDPAEMVGLAPGEALGCVNRLDDPRGCGWGELCQSCPLGSGVRDTLATQAGRAGVEGWLPVAGTPGRGRCVRISTAHVVVCGRQLVMAFLEDVTERRRAEDALRASEEKYRHLVEDISDVIFATDAGGILTYISPAARRVMGYAPEELTGKHFSAVVYPEDLAGVERRFREVLQERLGPYEFRYRNGSGEIRWARTLSTPVRENGASVGLRGVFSDITEARRLQEQLVAAQKMEALGQLAGGLAHDMNNILQAMASVVMLVKSDGSLTPTLRARCEELSDQIRRGAALTRQLLLFSRQDTARLEAVDVNQMINGVLNMLRRLVRENVELRVVPADGEAVVRADRGQLEQVLINLVVNAADAMPEGGVVELRTGAGEGKVWLAVRDGGCGIPPEIRRRIFEPFFTTKEAGRGTGIGLAVVHGIVTGLGGSVEVSSDVGVGSTFTVILPRDRERPRTPSGELPSVEGLEELAGRGEHILLVEDEEGIRTALAEVLTGLGYRVTEAGSAGEAAVLDDAAQPDVLLTDLVLPDASGVDLAVNLVERWPRLAVIMMSGYTADQAVRLGAAAGMVRFLQKPFEIHRLAQEIRAALDERAEK